MRGTSAHAGDPSSDVLIEFRFFCCMYPVRLLWWIHPGCLAFLHDAIIGGKIIVWSQDCPVFVLGLSFRSWNDCGLVASAVERALGHCVLQASIMSLLLMLPLFFFCCLHFKLCTLSLCRPRHRQIQEQDISDWVVRWASNTLIAKHWAARGLEHWEIPTCLPSTSTESCKTALEYHGVVKVSTFFSAAVCYS